MIVKKKNSFKQIIGKISNLIKPKNYLIKQASSSMKILRDVQIPMRDGKFLNSNIYMPSYEGVFPPLLHLDPTRKDVLCKDGYMHIQYRFARQPGNISFSNETGFEAPDPDFWVANGYVVVNIDKRGFGTTPGDEDPQVYFGEEEIKDLYDAVEWAGVQPWSNSNVGLLGVSYLAINQYKVAAMNPPHLKAICPWEGGSDLYKDWFYPGGVEEYGFTPFLFNRLKQFGFGFDMNSETIPRKLRDDWWKGFVADLEEIKVPSLNCVSFTNQTFHSRGSQRFYERSGSEQKWLYTHRNGEWTEYYSIEATAYMRKFFDYFLKGIKNNMEKHPKVRIEVREFGDTVKEVRYENSWPPSNTSWTTYFLQGNDQKLKTDLSADSPNTFDLKKGSSSFSLIFKEDTEITGPIKLTLFIQLQNCDDANIFAGIQKFHNGKEVNFEGVYGFPNDIVSNTALRVALRKINEKTSLPYSPDHDFDTLEPLQEGEVAKLEFQFSPSSTYYRKDDELRLVIQGQYFIDGRKIHQPFRYKGNSRGKCTILSSDNYPSEILLPVIHAEL